MKFEVFCQHSAIADRLEFYVFGESPDGSRNIFTSLDKMEFSRHIEGYVEQPTFSLSGNVVKPFLKAMANTLKELDIKADGEPILENELTSVRYHLEDMRRLVFKEEPNE